MREKQFENKIKRLLKEKGAYFIKYWGGGNYTKAGVPDILACYRGFFLGIEVKGKGGKPSSLQLYNLEQIRKAGGYGLLVYPRHYPNLIKVLEHIEKRAGEHNCK